ncbi:MAG: GDP-mannose 4,6-dehydratase [Candidatus Magasanikbacteria bacterium]|nr:GDP-mannose 4,6-dehydratase [Candidatus Magasanikbacteria bacterium]
MPKRAFITGIAGQDGSYLAELLLGKGYQVHGLIARSSHNPRERLAHLAAAETSGQLQLHYGDLTDSSSLFRILTLADPDELYNLGAQSHVAISFEIPEYTANIVGLGTVRLLEWMRASKKPMRFFQASSAEMFGAAPAEVPQRETTPVFPTSPYACAKTFAHFMTINYRENYQLFACTGIMFNHESPRRAENFVTRKIARGVAEILAGTRRELRLGNLAAEKDWGYAQDFVEAMWLSLQQDKPDDYVIATGESHAVQEFVDEAFRLAGLQASDYVVIDSQFFRPTDTRRLVGDPGKAREKLGWQPRTSFRALVRLMVEADCARLGVKLPMV